MLAWQWLTTTYLDKIKSLETALIRKYLARRRWHRWYNAIKAMNRMRSFASGLSRTGNSTGSSSPNPGQEETEDMGLPEYTLAEPSGKEGRWV